MAVTYLAQTMYVSYGPGNVPLTITCFFGTETKTTLEVIDREFVLDINDFDDIIAFMRRCKKIAKKRS